MFCRREKRRLPTLYYTISYGPGEKWSGRFRSCRPYLMYMLWEWGGTQNVHCKFMVNNKDFSRIYMIRDVIAKKMI